MSHLYTYRPKVAIQQFVQIVLPLLLLLTSSAGLAQTIEIRLGQVSYEIELAITPAQRQRGLMHRQYL